MNESLEIWVGTGIVYVPGTLTASLVIQKLTGSIDWSWWYVFLPVLILAGMVAFGGLLALLEYFGEELAYFGEEKDDGVETR